MHHTVGKAKQRERKRIAKQKAIRRFAKNRAYVFPGIVVSSFMWGVFGATVSWTIVDHPISIILGAFMGTWTGIVAANWLVMKGHK